VRNALPKPANGALLGVCQGHPTIAGARAAFNHGSTQWVVPSWQRHHAASRRPGAATRCPAATSSGTPTGQAIAYLSSRENEAEARQAKALTKTRRGGSPSTSRGCRSCWVGAESSRREPGFNSRLAIFLCRFRCGEINSDVSHAGTAPLSRLTTFSALWKSSLDYFPAQNSTPLAFGGNHPVGGNLQDRTELNLTSAAAVDSFL
jgi:hypothetical protein